MNRLRKLNILIKLQDYNIITSVICLLILLIFFRIIRLPANGEVSDYRSI
nr:MAG TPA: hypothetical protein [Caudoviricetes sp.]